jgi:hypothetical protein
MKQTKMIEPRVREIAAAVSALSYGVSRDEIFSDARGARICQARATVYHVAHNIYGKSVPHIAYYCGDKAEDSVRRSLDNLRDHKLPNSADILADAAAVRTLSERYAAARYERETGKQIIPRGLPMVRVTQRALVLMAQRAATDHQEKTREPGDPRNKDWWDKGNRRFATTMAAVTKTEQAA